MVHQTASDPLPVETRPPLPGEEAEPATAPRAESPVAVAPQEAPKAGQDELR